MAEYITKIRTENGDKQIDYLALANLPTTDNTLTISGAFADAKVTGDKIKNINTSIESLETNKADKTYVDEVAGNINIENVAPKDHTHTKDNITDFAHTHEAEDIIIDDETNLVVALEGKEVAGAAAKALSDAKEYVDEKYIFIDKVLISDTEETKLVLSTEWLGDAYPYTQELVLEAIKETDCPHISPVYDDDLTTALAQMKAWSMINKAVTSEGKITFTCFINKPEVEIPIQIEVHR